jgi:hypothetical protein
MKKLQARLGIQCIPLLTLLFNKRKISRLVLCWKIQGWSYAPMGKLNEKKFIDGH